MANETARIKELISILNEASKAYYEDNTEIISNFEYDRLYDELVELENKTGLVFANSPTINVGYEAADELLKERHESPMLSLDKTKEVDVLKEFVSDKKGLLSWKLDGLTVVITFENGKLLKAVTRGNGEIGEVITSNARTFVNMPLSIQYTGKLVIRGEAVISYSDFNKINDEMTEDGLKYKNPRNLCSGSVRQLDSAVTAKRRVHFYAFSLESSENIDFGNSNENKFKWLKNQGFDVVEYKSVTKSSMEEAVKEFAKKVEEYDIPSDGLVLLLDDIEFGKSLGRTAKYPKNSIAFKWKDEIAETVLLDVEWSPSRTGLINPIAVFEPVELEGTTVSRASLHNISIIRSLKLGIGDRINVYKANMIIPQVADNITQSDELDIPDKCPACGNGTAIKSDQGIMTLICPNAQCPAKKIKAFSNFVSRNCMNIDGISEETLEKFIGHGFINDFSDIFKLDQYKDEITQMQGFGEKSYQNIIDSVNISRETTCSRLLSALGISGVGRSNANAICRFFNNDFALIRTAKTDKLLEIDGVGEIMARSITEFFSNDENNAVVDRILGEVYFTDKEDNTGNRLSGLTFVITGSLEHYPNRDALKQEIESLGGKVAGSVSSKTSYLINNDYLSGSGKNKTAKELGIEIITEDDFIKKFMNTEG